MNIEKFSTEDGKQGYKIKGATFASSRNRNGAYFDPVEVFTIDNPPEKLNFAHKDYETDYSTGTKRTSAISAEIDGKMLKFSWDLETTNENFVKLIEEDNFGGFSPELQPKNNPIRSEEGERFYRSGDLEWMNTAILAKDQQPGFVGANEYELEKFEAFEDVVIKKPEGEEPKDNESFATSFVEVGEYVKVESTMEIGRVERIEKTEQGQSITIKLINGGETTVSETEAGDGRAVNFVGISDIMDYLMQDKNIEGFSKKDQEIDDSTENKNGEDDKYEKTQKEIEKFNQVANAKKQINDTKQIQKGSENAGVKLDSYKTQLTLKSIV